MKGLRLVLILIVLACLAGGFLAGRAINRAGCPPSGSDRLRAKIEEVQERILRANRKIAEVRREAGK